MDEEGLKAIDAFLARYTDGMRSRMCLAYSVGRVLLKSARRGEEWQAAISDDELSHVTDWIVAAVATNAPWLSNTDALGRPKKLMKFGDIAAIVREADKAMLADISRNGRVLLDSGDEQVTERLSEGYSIVRMMTPKALDRESSIMQHCIGGGAYDQAVAGDRHGFFSLRDRFNAPHATFQVALASGSVEEMQGKQNKPPADRYAPYVREAAVRLGWMIDSADFVVDVDGAVHEKAALPARLRLRGNLDMMDFEGKLPSELLSIGGDLRAVGCRDITELPQMMEIGGSLDVSKSGIARLQDGLAVTGDLDISGSKVVSLPEGLSVAGILKMTNVAVTEWRDDLSVSVSIIAARSRIRDWSGLKALDGVLYLPESEVERLADGLTIGGYLCLSGSMIEELPNGLEVGTELYLDRTRVTRLPDGLVVKGTLPLRDTRVRELGNDMKIGNLDLTGSVVTELPERLHVTGDLTLPYDHIVEFPAGVVVDGDVLIDVTAYRNPDDCPVDRTVSRFSAEDARDFIARHARPMGRPDAATPRLSA